MDYLFLNISDALGAVLVETSTYNLVAEYRGPRRETDKISREDIRQTPVIIGDNVIVRASRGTIFCMDRDGCIVRWTVQDVANGAYNQYDNFDVATGTISHPGDDTHFYVPVKPSSGSNSISVQRRLVSDGSLVSTVALPATDQTPEVFTRENTIWDGPRVYYQSDDTSAETESGLFIKFNIETGLVEDTVDTYNLAGGNTINTMKAMIDAGTHIWMLIDYANFATGSGELSNRWINVEKSTMALTIVLDEGNANLASFISSNDADVRKSEDRKPAIIGNKLWFETAGSVVSYDVDTLTATDSYGPFTNGQGVTIGGGFGDVYDISNTENVCYLYDEQNGLVAVDLTNGTGVVTEYRWMWTESSVGMNVESVSVVDIPELYEITGTVTVGGSPAALSVILLDQETQTQITETTSSGVDGSYTLTCLSLEPKTVICRAPDSETNYKILAHRIPTLQA